jgi:nicotinamide-nucleotide amidase
VNDPAALLERYRKAGRRLATAESCTGGMVSARLTEIAGSSDVVERGFVVYSNESKVELLGVSAEQLGHYGAVSVQVARAMAEGALARSRADVAISITGIAGPGGATAGKPVGLVYLGVASKGRETRVERQHFTGDRAAVRAAALGRALELLDSALD